MSFITIDPASIEVGDPIRKELFDRFKNNDDDHETRINDIEALASKVTFMKFLVQNAASFSSGTGLNYYEADESFTITNAFIRIFEKGSLAGSLEIDIKRSVTDLNSGSFTSIFTTKPKLIMSSSSDYDASTNQVFDTGQINISAGDFLRLDITQMPTGGVLGKFLITAYGE